MQNALTELEDVITDQLAALADASEDDRADAEDDAECERLAWRPLRAA